MGQFEDQVVWITGGGSGLGRAFALAFAREGAAVAVSGRRADRLAEVADAIAAGGGRAIAVPCDVTVESEVQAAVARVVSKLGRLDVAIANAGVGVTGGFEALSDAEWRHQLEVNLFGVVSTARHALPELRKTAGRLVLIGSVSGMLCAPGTSAYAASKFAVRGLGLTLAQELYGTGVTCTTIHPGFVATEISRVDNAGHRDLARPDPRPRALLWSAEAAADAVLPAIRDRRLEYVFTGHGKVGAWLGCHLPALVHLGMTRLRPGAASVTLKTKRWDSA